MEISPNVDDMLIENMTKVKLEPLPTKPIDVPRETSDAPLEVAGTHPESKQVPTSPEPEKSSAKEVSSAKDTKEAPTNEYGDKTEKSADPQDPQAEQNEYGLETETPKTYTEAEMKEYANRIMRERVARFERNSQQQQPTQQQQQQAAQQGFQYDENSSQDWQQQLESFVMQVADKREQAREAQFKQAIQQEEAQKFEMKFKQGMDKFNDYHTVLAGKRVTDEMLMAASDIADPAALFYAAAKRAPEELAKIADIKNPYVQAAAIGRLDEKLRKAPVKTSSAPKPISPTKADTTNAYTPKAVESNELDDMLIADKNNRIAQLNARRR